VGSPSVLRFSEEIRNMVIILIIDRIQGSRQWSKDQATSPVLSVAMLTALEPNGCSKFISVSDTCIVLHLATFHKTPRIGNMVISLRHGCFYGNAVVGPECQSQDTVLLAFLSCCKMGIFKLT
jgi:hypothetical protein